MFQQKSYQANQSGPHLYETEGPNAPKWYIVDAKDQVVGRIASMLAEVILGKHKPTFTRHADTGDFIVVLNSDKIVFTGNKLDQKMYRNYSGYIGGLKEKTAREQIQKDSTEVIRRAVWGMTNKSNLARLQMSKLKIYTGDEHPHAAQNPQALPVGATRRTTRAKTMSQDK